MTGASKQPLPVAPFPKCLLNLSTRQQPLLPVLHVFGAGWVGIHPFWRHDRSIPAAEGESRPSILQLNTEGLTASTISVIEQLGPTLTELLRLNYLTAGPEEPEELGRNLSIPSISWTPAARHGASSTNWQVQTLLSPAPHLSKLHRFTTPE